MTTIKSLWLAAMAAFLWWPGHAGAQESLNACGGNTTGSGGTTAFSIGQVVYSTHTGSWGTVAEGIQHAFEMFPVGYEIHRPEATIKAFPNPATDWITLQAIENNERSFTFRLYDSHGELLLQQDFHTGETTINMANLPASLYFLTITHQTNQSVQSFKIIKK